MRFAALPAPIWPLRCAARRNWRPGRLSRLTLLACVSAAAPAAAADIVVTTLADVDVDDGACSLREAIQAANIDAPHHGCVAGGAADTVDLTAFPSGSVIELTAALPPLEGDVTVRGPGALDLAIDGMDLWPILEIDGGSGSIAVVVEDLTLRRGFGPGPFGWAGAATVREGDTALFRRVHFLDNRATNAGGAIHILSGPDDGLSTVSVRACLFEGNEAMGPVGGGAINVTEGSGLTVDSSTFVGNRASSTFGTGGAIGMRPAFVEIRRSTFSGNQANSGGGAIFALSALTSPTPLTLRLGDTTITANEAEANGDGEGDGGGVHLRKVGAAALTFELQNTLIAGNFDDPPLDEADVYVFDEAGVGLVSHGFNLIGSNEGSATLFPAGAPNAAGDFAGTLAAPLVAHLEPLADNGGALPTHLPVVDASSLVVDQGDCLFANADQRGFVVAPGGGRAVDQATVPDAAGGDRCDIGAVEAGAINPLDQLLVDGFESGDTAAWSATVPVTGSSR